MKLLIITPIFPPEIGGPATYIAELLEKFKDRHKITVLGFFRKGVKIGNVKMEKVSASINPFARQWRLFSRALTLARKSEAVYVQGGLVVGLAGVIAAKLAGKRVTLKFVGDEVWEAARLRSETAENLEDFFAGKLGLRAGAERFLQSISLFLADVIITPSNWLKHFLVSVYGVRPGKVKVIFNAVQPILTRKKKSDRLLIVASRLVPWKQIDKIIMAVNEARKQKPFGLMVVGNGPERPKLTKLVAKLKASEWVKMPGKLSAQATRLWIKQAEKLILFSTYEGLSHTLIEAMLSETAVIASDLPANREALGRYGSLVSFDDVPGLIKAILSKVTGKQTAMARKWAEKRYGWPKHLADLEKVLWAK